MKAIEPPVRPKNLKPQSEGRDLGSLGGDVEKFGMRHALAGEVEDIVEVEDAQPMRGLPTPTLPSRAEIEAHRIDHWPPRSWCDECNEGFGRERGHASVAVEFALVSMDYAFLTKMGLVVKEGEHSWNDPDTLKMLIVKDSLSKSVFAHAVPKKGIDEKRFAVDMVVQDCLWLGYSKILLKSDNAPAIVALLKQHWRL